VDEASRMIIGEVGYDSIIRMLKSAEVSEAVSIFSSFFFPFWFNEVGWWRTVISEVGGCRLGKFGGGRGWWGWDNMMDSIWVLCYGLGWVEFVSRYRSWVGLSLRLNLV